MMSRSAATNPATGPHRPPENIRSAGARGAMRRPPALAQVAVNTAPAATRGGCGHRRSAGATRAASSVDSTGAHSPDRRSSACVGRRCRSAPPASPMVARRRLTAGPEPTTSAQRRFVPRHPGVGVPAHPPEPPVGGLGAHTKRPTDIGPPGSGGHRLGDRRVALGRQLCDLAGEPDDPLQRRCFDCHSSTVADR